MYYDKVKNSIVESRSNSESDSDSSESDDDIGENNGDNIIFHPKISIVWRSSEGYFSNYFANAILFLNSPVNNISQQQMHVPFLCVSAQKSLKIKELFCIFKEDFYRESFEIKLNDKVLNYR